MKIGFWTRLATGMLLVTTVATWVVLVTIVLVLIGCGSATGPALGPTVLIRNLDLDEIAVAADSTAQTFGPVGSLAYVWPAGSVCLPVSRGPAHVYQIDGGVASDVFHIDGSTRDNTVLVFSRARGLQVFSESFVLQCAVGG